MRKVRRPVSASRILATYGGICIIGEGEAEKPARRNEVPMSSTMALEAWYWGLERYCWGVNGVPGGEGASSRKKSGGLFGASLFPTMVYNETAVGV